MALRPAPDEIIRGVQHSLAAQIVPALPAPYAAAQAGYASHVLSALLALSDGAAQQLVDDNAALRALLAHAATLVDGCAAGLAAAGRQAAAEQDADVRLSTLAPANDRLRALVSRFVPLAVAPDAPAGLLTLLLDALETSAQRRLVGAL